MSSIRIKMWVAIILHQNWTQIKVLYMRKNNITDETIEILLKVEWPYLTKLWLNLNALTDKGVEKILRK